MTETNYSFRARMLEVHKKGMRDDSVWPRHHGLIVTEAFDIVFSHAADEVGRRNRRPTPIQTSGTADWEVDLRI